MKARRIMLLLALVAGALAIPAVEGGSALAAADPAAPVNVTHDPYAQNEESLGMDPTGALLAGAWNDWNYNDGCGFSYSTDGGSSWTPQSFVPGLTRFTNDPDVPGTGAFVAAGDPAVAFNPRFGVFDVVCQAFGGTSSQIQLLATTFDQGQADPNADVNDSYGSAAWTTPVAISTGKSNGAQKGHNGQFPDHESITVDTSTGVGHHYGRIYVAWAQFNGNGRSPIQLAFSDDNGASWTGPIAVSDKRHAANQDARVVIAPDGTLYTTFTGGHNESLKNNFIAVAESTDGGSTWGSTQVVASLISPVPGVLPNSQYRVFSDVTSSVDQATGRLVMAFNDMRTGPSQVYVVRQVAPGDVSAWTDPEPVASSSAEQFFPWMSAAPGGRLDLVFYDRSCDPDDTLNCVTLASSSDEGGSWSSTALLSSGFDGDAFDACVAFLQPIDCGTKFLGDYIAVASTDAGAISLFTEDGPSSQDVFSVAA